MKMITAKQAGYLRSLGADNPSLLRMLMSSARVDSIDTMTSQVASGMISALVDAQQHGPDAVLPVDDDQDGEDTSPELDAYPMFVPACYA